jgi:hypothetical protein
MGNGTRNLKTKVDALALDVEGLLKLLGGTPDQRERFWEIIKGITTPAVLQIIEADLGAAQANVKSALNMVTVIRENAKQLSAGH